MKQSPTPLAQMKVFHHYTSKKGAMLISMNGREDDAKWVTGRMCSYVNLNRKALIITMPEWLAVKSGLIPMGALGANNDKFRDKSPADSSAEKRTV